ncbi:MAG: hypothetical protein NC110_01000 [Ruminococcus sp.]|nr:hypothetical protein [Ruminococcus sp.]
MDELEKNESLPEENVDAIKAEEPAADTEETFDKAVFDEAENEVNEQDEALEKELNEIRDMFQQELDKAASGEADDSEMLIQELDEIHEDAETDEDDDGEIPEDELCECCGEKRRDESFGEDYPYCAECREMMKRNPLNWFGVIAIVLTIGITALSFFLIKDDVNDFSNLIVAESAYSEHKLATAASYYQQYVSRKNAGDNVSMKAVRNMIYTMADLGYYGDSNVLIGQYYSDAALNRPWNKRLKEIKSEYDILTNTSNILNETFGDALNGGDLNYKENMKKADKLIEENRETGEYSEAFLEYGKYLLMLINKDDDEKQLEQLLKIEQLDGGKHPWIYITNLMNIASNNGDVELVKKYFDISMEINAEETTMYLYYANAYRFTEKPDADKILEIAQQAEEIYTGSQTSTPDFYRSYAIAYLFKADGEKAMDSITKYMQSCQPTVNDFNLYALCAAYADDDEAYKYAKETLESYGYKIGSSVAKFKAGKTTLENVLTEKGGDI